MPASVVRRFSDPEEYQRSIRAADIRLWPTSKGTFNAELTQITFDRLWIQRAQESLPRVYAGSVRPGRFVIGFLADQRQPAMLHRGMPVAPGVIVINDMQEMHRRTNAACRWGSLSLSHEDFLTACRQIAGRELAIPRISFLIRPRPELMKALLRVHSEAAALARNSPEILQRAGTARNIEDQLIRLMVHCLSSNEPEPMSVGQQHHAEIMASFEGFLRERISEPVYLAEMCAAAGVSERTLRLCCQEHLGMSPMRYLWLRRMYLAWSALSRECAETATVTQVATDNGFWELGRFAKEYSDLFGECPSETLKRKPVRQI